MEVHIYFSVGIEKRRLILYPQGGMQEDTFVEGIGWVLNEEDIANHNSLLIKAVSMMDRHID